ncbi:hypothetical protein NM208_g13049 [Fusarium decemcellulare]|uniref:Uncharacterized protein n=1 Tax=Fusarium decemcellulare TaxID=57161 RepID=A0ACC1RPV7_9HYPO|nr:hypothetical protein NM208_g13049 [Fusarium decemcellulare]
MGPRTPSSSSPRPLSPYDSKQLHIRDFFAGGLGQEIFQIEPSVLAIHDIMSETTIGWPPPTHASIRSASPDIRFDGSLPKPRRIFASARAHLMIFIMRLSPLVLDQDNQPQPVIFNKQSARVNPH